MTKPPRKPPVRGARGPFSSKRPPSGPPRSSDRRHGGPESNGLGKPGQPGSGPGPKRIAKPRAEKGPQKSWAKRPSGPGKGRDPGPRAGGFRSPGPVRTAPAVRPEPRPSEQAPAPAPFDPQGLLEDLTPLAEFLSRQVGRKWERVYGLIRAQLGSDEALREGILERLDELIVRQVERVPPSTRFPVGLRRAGSAGWSRGMDEGVLYVDPKDGVIKRARARVRLPLAKA